jgi:hypothetical protein
MQIRITKAQQAKASNVQYTEVETRKGKGSLID